MDNLTIQNFLEKRTMDVGLIRNVRWMLCA